jgi:hypothetical protein
LLIGIFGFLTAGFAIFLFDLLSGRSGASASSYVRQISILAVGALVFGALVLGGRRRWAYCVASGALAILCASGVYTLFWNLHHLLTRGIEASRPYFHLAERDKPFVVQQHLPLSKQLLAVVLVGLFIWLSTRFMFGRQSRRYYGFDQKL